jgi:MFS family permease
MWAADDRAPRRQKSLWLAAMFLCFPSGFALGYIYAGLVGTAWGWRWAFLLEAAAMAPLALLCLLGPAADIRRAPSAGADAGAPRCAGPRPGP